MEQRLTVTVEEAGRLLGISRNLAYELISQGKIPAIRLGQRRVVVPLESLKRYLANSAIEPTPGPQPASK